MNTRNPLIFTTLTLALAVGVGTYAFKASSQEGGPFRATGSCAAWVMARE